MILKLTIEDQTYDIDVPSQQIEEAGGFYDKMDQDMDKGWQMSRFWVEKPDLYQRGQIVADKILGRRSHRRRRAGITGEIVWS